MILLEKQKTNKTKKNEKQTILQETIGEGRRGRDGLRPPPSKKSSFLEKIVFNLNSNEKNFCSLLSECRPKKIFRN